MLKYISTAKVDEDDDFLKELDTAVDDVNKDDRLVRNMLILPSLEEHARRAAQREVYYAKQEAREEGLAEGRAEERDRIAAINNALLDANRIDDLKRAAADPSYYEELFKEFNLE